MLLFFSPGKNTHQKDCDFQRAYLQPTHCYNTAHSLAQLVDFYGFFTILVSAFPAIFASALAKRHTQTPGYKLILLP